VRKAVFAICPEWLRISDFVSIGLRKAVNEVIPEARPYTKARAEEHERDAFNEWIDLVTRILVAFFGGGMLSTSPSLRSD
jgi:hypothetical protein